MDQLPVWLTLRGRGVLVVGGGLAATAKARLALAAGAQVTMVAPALAAEAAELATVGEIRHVQREFIAGDLDGHVVADRKSTRLNSSH